MLIPVHLPSLCVLHGDGVGRSAAGDDVGARGAPSSPKEDLGQSEHQ